MSNLTDFFPSGGGGGLKPKFQEFNASGTFTPSQALIDAGGYIEIFLVGAGSVSNNNSIGGAGGETIIKKMYLTSVNDCSVTIGSGANTNGTNGGDSSFFASASGGSDLTALGGRQDGRQSDRMGAGFAGVYNFAASANGILGYGAGGSGANSGGGGGVFIGKANSGQGAERNQTAGSGYCLIKWYE